MSTSDGWHEDFGDEPETLVPEWWEDEVEARFDDADDAEHYEYGGEA